jgi:hypothetical protein
VKKGGKWLIQREKKNIRISGMITVASAGRKGWRASERMMNRAVN